MVGCDCSESLRIGGWAINDCVCYASSGLKVSDQVQGGSGLIESDGDNVRVREVQQHDIARSIE